MKKHSVCTLSLALAMSLSPQLAKAASHCKGLEETICGNTAACRWVAKREPAFGVSQRKAHCRLDVSAASKLAAGIAAQRK
jgi:hypothetical protein